MKLYNWLTSLTLLNSIINLLINIFVFRWLQTTEKQLERQLVSKSESPDFSPLVNIVIPMRNEQRNVVASLYSGLSLDYPNFEIIVVNDNSNDQTLALAKKIATEYPNKVRVLDLTTLPDGWVGKNHALWQGYFEVNSEAKWILFLDADIRLKPETLRKTLIYAEHQTLDFLSLGPGNYQGSFWYDILFPQMAKFYVFAALLTGLFSPKTGSIGSATANGAFILVRKNIYKKIEGHKAIKHCVLEDVELARNIEKAGGKLFYISATALLTASITNGLPSFWESMSKNWFLVARRNWVVLGLIVWLEIITGIAPYLILGMGLRRRNIRPTIWGLNIAAILLTMYLNSEMLDKFQITKKFGPLYVLTVGADIVLIILSALRISIRRSVEWKGRNIKV